MIIRYFIAASRLEVHTYLVRLWHLYLAVYSNQDQADRLALLFRPPLSIPSDSDGGAALAVVVHHVDRRRVEHEVALLEGDPPVAVDIRR